jgi:hypothetical protein
MSIGILQSLGGAITPEEKKKILASQYLQGVMDLVGHDKMINAHYDEWSPTDGIPKTAKQKDMDEAIRGLKESLGSTYTEEEAMRALKESMGSTFTEREGREILGLNTAQRLNTAQQEYLRDLKGQLGSQFTEREGMRMLGEGNPHIGEPVPNLGLPDTASYKAGYTSGGYNPNWGSGKYNYQKNIYDVQTIDMLINQGAINPKIDTITPRPDIGEDAFHVKLASTDNSFYNQQLGAFFPYNKESGFTGGRTGDDRFNQNPYKNTVNPYSGLSYPWQTPIPLDFNNFS